jgi:nitroreductase
MKTINGRSTKYDINDVFLKRWSPRSFLDKTITKEQLMTLFEAARWAPSSYNNQSWRFIYGLKGTKSFDTLFSLLGEFNQMWCKNTSALVVVISKKVFDYNKAPSITHSFDTGTAWGHLAIQAAFMDLSTHGMQGFDYEKAKTALDVPDEYNVEMMFAVGYMGKKEDLPKDLADKEIPSGRKEISEIVFEGKFKA